MKVMVRRTTGGLSLYVPKRDLEVPIVDAEQDALWGGWIRLKNGWVLDLPMMPVETSLPVTVVAKRRGGDDA